MTVHVSRVHKMSTCKTQIHEGVSNGLAAWSENCKWYS